MTEETERDRNERASRYADTLRNSENLRELEIRAGLFSNMIAKLPKDLQEWLRDEYKSIKQILKDKEETQNGIPEPPKDT